MSAFTHKSKSNGLAMASSHIQEFETDDDLLAHENLALANSKLSHLMADATQAREDCRRLQGELHSLQKAALDQEMSHDEREKQLVKSLSEYRQKLGESEQAVRLRIELESTLRAQCEELNLALSKNITELAILSKSHSEIQSQLEHERLDRTLSEQNQARTYRSIAVENAKKLEALQQENSALLTEIQDLKRLLTEKNSKNEGRSKALGLLEQSLGDQRARLTLRKSRLRKYAARLRAAKSKALTLDADLEKKSEQLLLREDALDKREKTLNEAQAVVETDCTALHHLKDELALQSETLSAQALQVDQEFLNLQLLKRELNQQHDELLIRAEQVQKREAQLKTYADNLGCQKAEFQALSQKIASDMELACTFHPLKDYLKLTESELSKIETLLRKTPTIAPERAQLEQALTQMSEQRDFLTGIVSASQLEFRKYASLMANLHQSGTFALLPPPPPALKAIKRKET